MLTLQFVSLSSRFWNWFTVFADFVLSDSEFHTGAVLLLNAFFLVLVLLYCMYSLYSECLVLSSVTFVKKIPPIQFT